MNTDLSVYFQSSYRRRKIKSIVMLGLLIAFGVVALVPFFSILSYVIVKGAPALSLQFFSELPKPVGETGGGMANALLGTAALVGLASLIGIPWGIVTGVYLSEFGQNKRSQIVRFSVDMLASVPSIVIGLFVYAFVVMPMKRFSALAGALALAILMVPTVARTSEEILKMVPVHIREAGLALGIPRWKVILRIVLKGSLGPIMTGVMLSIARVAGETAPLLFTAFGNRFWSFKLDQPISSLPVQIYTYAISPFEEWHAQAWAGSLVLVLFVFSVNLVTRFVLFRTFGRGNRR